jgi:regulator of protease activity HflC (stomatin/prohibitin superfamily)
MWIVALAFVAFVVALIVLGVRIVPQGHAYVIERLGRYHATLRPGLNLVVPVLDQVRARVSIMETVVDIPKQSVITRDNAAVSADGVLFYQVLDPIKATYEVANLQRAIEVLAMTTLRNVMGSMELDELLSQRDTINARLLQAIDEATGSWGVRAARIEIRDIVPPDDIVQAMARQLKAERDRRAQILEADATKESQIRIAQGKLEAAKLEAEARERLAAAEAKATQLVSEAVAQGSVQAINYFLGQKYVEALTAFAQSQNQKLLILPAEFGSLAGTLAGVAEIAKSALGEAAKGNGTAPPHRPWGEPRSGE